jgi:hypothetical protein
MMMEASVQRPRQAADRGGWRSFDAWQAERCSHRLPQIARQFGLSQSDVRKALASGASRRVTAWLERWKPAVRVAGYSTGGWEHHWDVEGPEAAIAEVPARLLCASAWTMGSE